MLYNSYSSISRFEWKKKTGKKGGVQILGWMIARGGGGGHSDAYCVQQGVGWGGLKFGRPLGPFGLVRISLLRIEKVKIAH